MKEKLLTVFHSGGYSFALESLSVREIVRLKSVTPVPRSAPWLTGLTFFRGMAVPVMDIACRLGLTDQSAPCGTLIVFETDTGPVGLCADSVEAMIPETVFTHGGSEDIHQSVKTEYIRSWFRTSGGALVAELDPERIFRYGRTGKPRADISAAEVPVPTRSEKMEETAILTVRIGGEEYGFLLRSVLEVLRAASLVTAPESEASIAGVLPLREKITAVLDPKRILRIRDSGSGDGGEKASGEKCIVVLRSGNRELGVLVDSFGSVVRIRDSVDSLSAAFQSPSETRLLGIARPDGGKRLIFVLDEKKLFSMETLFRNETEHNEEQAMPLQPAEEQKRVLVFRVGENEFCMDIHGILEVGRQENLVPVPKSGGYTAGLISFHGEAVPVIDLAGLLDLRRKQRSDNTGRIIFIRHGDTTAGLAVDAVTEVRGIPVSGIVPPPESVTADMDVNLIQGICMFEDSSHFLILVDAEKILSYRDARRSRGEGGRKTRRSEKN